MIFAALRSLPFVMACLLLWPPMTLSAPTKVKPPAAAPRGESKPIEQRPADPDSAQSVAAMAVRKGLNYEYGNTVPQSYVNAARWYLVAAKEGDPDGQFGIALLLTTGRGVPQNFALGYMWASIAAATKGSPKLVELRDRLATKLSPQTIDAAQSRATVCWNSRFKNCD